MALPILYWMLECGKCGSRRVVHDSYLKFVGTGQLNPPPGAGWGGPPLEDRYPCPKGCPGTPRVIGSIFSPEDREMRTHEPYESRVMTRQESEEWRRLIREAEGNEQNQGARSRSSDDSPIITPRDAVVFLAAVITFVVGSVGLVFLLPPGETRDTVAAILRPIYKVAVPLMSALPVILIAIRMQKRQAGKGD
jgi:hypothetical protein